jgi:hypothetical protein
MECSSFFEERIGSHSLRASTRIVVVRLPSARWAHLHELKLTATGGFEATMSVTWVVPIASLGHSL